ncbi:uncharacterized protein LOC131160390 [Malania oleifera]|uniref:uncharacterized protein LOC131160390 n=1 Tax=Malania oleifera TaxID=397392 RepID=UPI0025ADCB82|nr:uncharacterized protein LOC131160390 [Malania oleifera]
MAKQQRMTINFSAVTMAAAILAFLSLISTPSVRADHRVPVSSPANSNSLDHEAVALNNMEVASPPATSADPWYRQKLPPQPRRGFYVYLRGCIDTLTTPCGRRMQLNIFANRTIGLDAKCCRNLQKMGYLCHRAMSWTLANLPKFATQGHLIYHKSDSLYTQCTKTKL